MTSIDAFKLPTWGERGGEYVRRLVRDLVLTPEQAAGIVGNLGFESVQFTVLQEIKPTVPESPGGYGVAQWTGPRRKAFEGWCAVRGISPASDEANYGFLTEELRGDYASFTAALRRCVTIEEACILVHRAYETPSDVLDGSYRSQPARLSLAKEALAGALALAPDPPTALPPPPTANPLVGEATEILTRLLAASPLAIPEELKMTLRLVQRIIDAICGPEPSGPTVTPVDVGKLLDDLATKHPTLNVRTSVVDLMTALGMDPSPSARAELADDLGIAGNPGSADLNQRLYTEIMRRVAANGGAVPDELL